VIAIVCDPVTAPSITFEAAAFDRRLATLILFADESLTGDVRGLGFEHPGTKQ